MFMQPNPLPVGQQPQRAKPAGDLDKLIRFLIDRHGEYAATRAYVEVSIRWKEGRIEMVNENRQVKPADLDKA
jgi:hypothetical protein